jgi:uncharacterized protein (DUF488 family)
MRTTLFTIGYQQRSLRDVLQLIEDNRIDVLLDVRETAWSHKPGFSKRRLSAALSEHGVEYVHASFAGNPKWLRGTASSHEECLAWYDWYLDEFTEIVESFEYVIAEWARAGKRVCLLCFERHADDCHRGVLAKRWEERGAGSVRHLAVEGCERLLGR